MNNTANCSPLSDNKKYTCYDNKTLNRMKILWNKRHPEAKIEDMHPEGIWKSLKNNLRDICNTEVCWLRQEFMKDESIRSIMAYTFAPFAPKAWKKNPYEWLSSLDIERVMKQYESKYKCFAFLGPSPIDFDKEATDDTGGECVWDELCNFDLIELYKKGKHKIGVIFNLDPHYKSGSHWVSMFINVKEQYIFYFDSNGTKIPKQINVFAQRIIKQASNAPLNSKMILKENHPFTHQKSNTECGMYSLHLIISLLTDSKSYTDFMSKRISDSEMKAFRNKYFNHEE
jgi:hypothetical protein